MSNEILGIGYAHAMPTRAPRALRPPRDEITIAQRWLSYWEARCASVSKFAADPVEEFSALKQTYLRRMRKLLVARISWTAIRRANLDSPLQTGTEFDRALCLAIERRRTMGHKNENHKLKRR